MQDAKNTSLKWAVITQKNETFGNATVFLFVKVCSNEYIFFSLWLLGSDKLKLSCNSEVLKQGSF